MGTITASNVVINFVSQEKMFCNEVAVIARYDRSNFIRDPMPLVFAGCC